MLDVCPISHLTQPFPCSTLPHPPVPLCSRCDDDSCCLAVLLTKHVDRSATVRGAVAGPGRPLPRHLGSPEAHRRRAWVEYASVCVGETRL